jgi:hypothetical protein
MKLTEKQKIFLLHMLHDSCKYSDIDELFGYKIDYRRKIYNEILDQQDDFEMKENGDQSSL